MISYIYSIQISFILFPILAFFFTIPYSIWMYRKYGSINWMKTIIVFSFLLYMESIYFLVVLPLPELEEVHTSVGDMINLVPFSFVSDFIKESPLRFSSPATYLEALKHGTLFVPIFNIAMFVPFGIYLKYYFNVSWKKVVMWSALLSLFFELTQLTGLYFIYPGPFRLADVDDIIQNTLGGILGFWIGGFLEKILTSRESMDSKAFENGKKVSGIRRILAYMIDMAFLGLCFTFYHAVVNKPNTGIFDPSIFFDLSYFTILPLINGKTIGSKILRFHMEVKENWLFFIRAMVMFIYFHAIPTLVTKLNRMSDQLEPQLLFVSIFFITFIFIILYWIVNIFVVLTSRYFIFDKLTKVRYISDIKIPKSFEGEAK